MSHTKQEVLNMMHSDMQMWEAADTEDLGNGRLNKTIDLPWGIGEYTVTLEGLTDGNKKREAVSAYAAHIRAIIDDKINDEAITARAALQAAYAEQDDSRDSIPDDTAGVPDSQRKADAVQEAARPYEEDAPHHDDIGATLTARATELRERINRSRLDLTRWSRELKALDAALAALEELDAPEDKGTT